MPISDCSTGNNRNRLMPVVSEINDIPDVDRASEIVIWVLEMNQRMHQLVKQINDLLKIEPITRTVSICQLSK